MIAPEFECVTIEGELLHSDKIGGKPLLITNLTACGFGTLEDYEAILEASIGKINVLAMEPHPKKSVKGLVVDTENDINRKFHETYREYFSSRTCYLIDDNRRILEKFDINQWEDYLTKYLDTSGEKLKD